MGAAGEIAARRFLKLPLGLKTTFDNGVDLIWRGHTVDVKATRWVPTIMGRYLQWPENKKIKADYILMTAVRLEEKEAVILGFCSRQELEHADVNPERDIPCKEIPIRKLKDPAELLTLSPKRKGSKAKKYATGSGKSVTANA